MNGKIMIMGGYGQVGRYVTLELLKTCKSCGLVVAGRSLEKAASFAKEHAGAFEALKLDIYDTTGYPTTLENIKAVVMCLTPENNDFAKYCAQNGIHYIDISPSDNVAQTIKNYHKEAINSHCSCVLGVGISPGLSNLLVKELLARTDNPRDIRISLLLGVGEQHGEDGVKWLLDNINRKYKVRRDGAEEIVTPFIQKTKTTFLEPLGKRTAYCFNLADQFIVSRTLNVDSVSSYFCYDSKFVTRLVSIRKRMGRFSLLRFKKAYRVMVKLFKLTLSLMRGLHIGTDVYGIQIDAIGLTNSHAVPLRIGAKGNNNSMLTAHIAAFAVTKLCAGVKPCGVFYLELAEPIKF